MNKFIFLMFAIYSSFAVSDEIDCNNMISTLDINYCAGVELSKAELEMTAYLAKSKERNSDDKELIAAIDNAQQAWGVYIEAHCSSIYTMWRDGSIRGVMSLNCKTKLTKQRTHEIWSNFLTYMDSTPPVLPEPKV
ncbi:lysozyme inhibitor LprI family protein [Psychromonas sp. SP041]|uniref:lysozyme inhibitor LprI family protein n=1 Tax=Psychromonas sp. SP041 TaxID=1365007 RepID=UPI0010C795B3|nr:lysozyme inhibitor LprI family protein [Psychromonas sp. SP041]